VGASSGGGGNVELGVGGYRRCNSDITGGRRRWVRGSASGLAVDGCAARRWARLEGRTTLEEEKAE
jgi:hypothetical protein